MDENTVQKDFNLGERGDFIISVKNPKRPPHPKERPSSIQRGEFRPEPALYPTHLQEKFNNHRVAPLSTTEFLEYKGTELFLTKKNKIDLKEDQALNECLSGFPDEDIEQQIEAIEGCVSMLPP